MTRITPASRIATEPPYVECVSEIADQLVVIAEAAGNPDGFLDDVDHSLLAKFQHMLAAMGGEGMQDRAALLDALFEDALAEAKHRMMQTRHT